MTKKKKKKQRERLDASKKFKAFTISCLPPSPRQGEDKEEEEKGGNVGCVIDDEKNIKINRIESKKKLGPHESVVTPITKKIYMWRK